MFWRAFAIALLFAVPLAHSVYRIPVQPSEVVDIVQYVGATPDVPSAFALGLRASRTMVRPMRQLHTKVLLDLAEWRRTPYHMVFRGVHAALAVLLILAFVVAAGPASFVDLCAVTCALAVLTGLHTFTAFFREAYPVNHFLIVTLYGWAVLILAQHGRGVWADVAAAACVALALLTLESGLLVALVAVAAHVAGWRGVSRRGLALIALVLVAYAYLRVVHLGVEAPQFAERPIAYGVGVLSTEEQRARFGHQRLLLYAYNVLSGASAILFSQPTNGRFTLVAELQDGRTVPWMLTQVVASLATTGLIVWSALRRDADGRRGYKHPSYIVAGAVIVANAAISYVYAKDEIIAFAGTFYALAAYTAARSLFVSMTEHWRRAIIGATLACALMALWATRVAALHVVLHEQAFFVRNDWVGIEDPAPVTNALRQEALRVPTSSPRSWPSWVAVWIGER